MKKILVYVNKAKDENNEWFNEFSSILEKKGLSFTRIFDEDLNKNVKADVLFVLGGDGTILSLIDFSYRNDVPLIGINAGKIGFLTEFERCDTAKAVDLFVNGKLIEDHRMCLEVIYNGKSTISLNDAFIERIIGETNNAMVCNVKLFVNKNFLSEIVGDGLIVSSPTGSTAYSFSCGGPILAPGINAFSLTPVSAHSLSIKPMVFSADQKVEIVVGNLGKTGLFADGKLISSLNENDKVTVVKAKKRILFLRKKSSDFYKRLVKKLSVK